MEASAHQSDWYLFPAGYRDRLEDEPDDEKMHARTVADLISSMTEDQAYMLYAHVTGATHGDNLRASWF